MRRSPEPAESEAAAAAPSKTRRKHDAHELQRLGQALAALDAERFAALPLPEALRDALLEYRRTRSHEGRRRQLQYVGKLMRRVDPQPLQAEVAAAALGPARQAQQLHAAERWRERLLADERELAHWLHAHPHSDPMQLRRLLRAARDDAARPAADRNPRAARALFRLLRRELDAAPEQLPSGAEPIPSTATPAR